ncbi:unnamed protein product [Penicillium salamii]|nr:unnamed protein product [Penicillium salamii]
MTFDCSRAHFSFLLNLSICVRSPQTNFQNYFHLYRFIKMPGVPHNGTNSYPPALDALKQVKKGLKRLFSRKKNRGQEDPDVENDAANVAVPGAGNLTQAEAQANQAPAADGATVAHVEGPAIKIVEPDMPVAKAAGESEFPAAEAEPSTKVVDVATQTGQYPSPILSQNED